MSKRRTPEQWQGLVDQQRDSGLSAMQFCKQKGIGYASFCNWRKRLSDEPVGDSDHRILEPHTIDSSGSRWFPVHAPRSDPSAPVVGTAK